MPTDRRSIKTLGRTTEDMPIVSDDFSAPRSAVFPRFLLRVLEPAFAAQDFAAVTAGANIIRNVFGPENDWPNAEMTFEENLADLTRHLRDFNERSAFAYCLLDCQAERYLGSLYLKPIKSKTGRDQRHEVYDAQAFLWLSTLHQELEIPLVQAQLSAWFEAEWSLPNVAWPGRNPSWEEWRALSLRPA